MSNQIPSRPRPSILRAANLFLSHPLVTVRETGDTARSAPMTRSQEEVDVVLGLVAAGHNDCEVSRRTGVPRTTVRDWRWGLYSGPRRPAGSDHRCRRTHDFNALPRDAYAYLLGMYLGDGYIAAHPRGCWRLRISSDARYPKIIEECGRSMEAVMPGQRSHVLYIGLTVVSRCLCTRIIGHACSLSMDLAVSTSALSDWRYGRRSWWVVLPSGSCEASYIATGAGSSPTIAV